MKTEPDCFGLEHLKEKPKRTEHWDGVRNYQARNFLRDGMQKGDLAFLYHSSCAEPGIAGIVKIARAAYPDHTAWDPDNEHFDPKSSPANPIWYMVDVRYLEPLAKVVTLEAIKGHPLLGEMPLVKRSRLSIQPVTQTEWQTILAMGGLGP